MALDGVRWVDGGGEFDLGYWLVFARGLQPAELAEALGAADEELVELTRIEASDVEAETDDVVVRVGAAAGWAFAIVEGGPVGDASALLEEVSLRAEALGMWRTVNADMYFEFAQDGQRVCGFEPGLEHERTGTDPDRLLPALRDVVGAVADGEPRSEAGDRGSESAMLGALGLAETAFGVELPRDEVLHGALLAGRIAE